MGTHVDHADAIVSVEHGQGIAWADLEPVGQRCGLAGIKGMQDQGRQREVIDQIHLPGDFDLILIVAVDLHQHVHIAAARLVGQLFEEVIGLGDHEAACARLLDGIARRIKPDRGDPGAGKILQNAVEIGRSLLAMDVDVDLLRREGGPDHLLAAILEGDLREGQIGPRAVDGVEILLGGAIGEDLAIGEEHVRMLGRLTLLQIVLEGGAVGGDMVDDEIGHHVDRLRQGPDIVPCAKTRVDDGVISGIEARIGTIEGIKEGQGMHCAEQALKRAVDHGLEIGKAAPA